MKQNHRFHVTLITGRTIEQGVGKECGKSSREYAESVAVCFIDPEDLKSWGIEENTNIQISTNQGSVVLKALKSLRTPHPGVIYIPYGPWANVVVDPETDGIGMPSLKGISAEIECASDKPVLDLKKLLVSQFWKE